METFIYDEKDYNFQVDISDDVSKFDKILQNLWDTKMNEGNIFWYKLNVTKERIINEEFLLQLNINRAQLKRPAADIQQINQPFNPNGFNFNSIKDVEKLFFISRANNIAEKHMVIVNVSPIEYGHILLVPAPEKCFSQILTEESLRMAVELCLLSKSRYFRVVFNSLGAYASVNHLHFHGYYLKHNMFLETAAVEEIYHPCYAIQKRVGKGFAFQLKNKEDMSFTVRNIFALIELMQKNNIPHNIYITRGLEFRTLEEYDKNGTSRRDCIRIFIWARKPTWGIKEMSKFNIATCELFGHMVIKNENGFDKLTYKEIASVLDDITSDSFQNLLSDVINLYRRLANKS